MLDNRPFLYWFFTVCCIGFLAALAQHYHFWAIMDAKDHTKISWVICAISAVASLLIGFYAYKGHASTDAMNRLWFISDAMVTLGMIGTVAGFLVMMGDGFTSMDPKDAAAMQNTIKTVGSGMGTILVTTLMGLITSVLLKLQLVIIDHEE